MHHDIRFMQCAISVLNKVLASWQVGNVEWRNCCYIKKCQGEEVFIFCFNYVLGLHADKRLCLNSAEQYQCSSLHNNRF